MNSLAAFSRLTDMLIVKGKRPEGRGKKYIGNPAELK
jgi:hypothetical protein